jgi:putative transposase
MNIKAYKYRIYPTSAQETLLRKTLAECQWLYNHCLEERKTSYETTKKSPSAYDQIKSITALKKTRSSLNSVHSQVLQNIPIRLELAFQAFFRRCKAGETPGYPRFKGKGQYHSFTYPQNNNAFRIIDNNRIRLSKIGNVKIKYHREMQGIIKACTVSRTPTGKWFVCISCTDIPENKPPINKLEIGIDMGLKTFATLSDNSRIANPRFFKHEEKALAKAQRKKEKLAKGSKERRKAGRAIPKIHERIANKRKDFLHKETNEIVKKYGIICVEDLSINDMMESGKKKRLSKSIADASWGLFLSLLSFKAENAGRTFVKVNPAYTTQDCSKCGTRKPLRLDERMYECGVCGLSIDRDLNASKNILTVGLHSLRKSLSSKSSAI